MARKTIVLIHGRDFKPPKAKLKKLWIDALRWGIQRDWPGKLAAFDRAAIEWVYYGDISNAYLEQATGEPAVDDTASRRVTLEALKELDADEFTKQNYRALPGAGGMMEAVADAISPLLGFFHLSDPLIAAVAPDMREYWNEESDYGTSVRARMIEPLKRALRRGGEVCVIGHSLGTLICWDTLWKFSRSGEYRPEFTDRKIDLWITLGSPLSDDGVQRHLRGAAASGERRYPSNVTRWVNFAAEDDYICHDEDVANDFKDMTRLGLTDEILDIGIYNLSVRDGKSNPHHEGGYLIDPHVAKTVADWL